MMIDSCRVYLERKSKGRNDKKVQIEKARSKKQLAQFIIQHSYCTLSGVEMRNVIQYVYVLYTKNAPTHRFLHVGNLSPIRFDDIYQTDLA